MAVHFYGKARVLWLNLDESPRTAARYQVTGVPTVLLFRDGQFLDRLPGPRGEQGLAERLGLG
jgi:thioredoxin-like negative regulator of GroEL